MSNFNRENKAAMEPLKLALNTIFEQASKEQANEVLFEPQQVQEPTAVEGLPMPVVPAGSTVLFVSYRKADRLEWQLKFGDNIKDEFLDQLNGINTAVGASNSVAPILVKERWHNGYKITLI